MQVDISNDVRFIVEPADVRVLSRLSLTRKRNRIESNLTGYPFSMTG